MVQSINATTPLEEARAALKENYDLKFTTAIAKVTSGVRARVKTRIGDAEWAALAPLIVQINRLKKERKALILAHVQQPPEIYFGVADKVGDNLTLLKDSAKLRQPVVVFAGVLSMAETLRLLAPAQKVLIPDSRVRCALASSMAPDDAEAIRSQYPGVKLLAHVNAPMSVKALADACVTSDNALAVVEAMPGDRVIMVPDQFLARNIARQTSKKIITWAGACETHDSFSPEDVDELRRAYPDARILAHPQNRPAVAAAADFVGSTRAMTEWIKTEKPAKVVILSEGAVSDNLAAAAPDTEFIVAREASPANRITLEGILWSLHTLSEEVTVPPGLAKPARVAVQRMLELSLWRSPKAPAGAH